jgi:hypothetical protein
VFGVAEARHYPPTLRVEVWASQSLYDPFYDDQPVEFFFRCEDRGYATIYQVRPCGTVEIIYPRPYHRWRPIKAGRVYSFSDLADDVRMDYHGLDGYAYVGIIVTRDPIHVVPWLEQAFYEHGLIVGRRPATSLTLDFGLIIENVEADIRFRLGVRTAPVFAMVPICIRPRAIVVRPAPFYPRYYPRYYCDGGYYVVTPDRKVRRDPPRNQPRPFQRRPATPPYPGRVEMPTRVDYSPPSQPAPAPSPDRRDFRRRSDSVPQPATNSAPPAHEPRPRREARRGASSQEPARSDARATEQKSEKPESKSSAQASSKSDRRSRRE